MAAYIAWFTKWMPESFFICLILTILVAALALIFCDIPVWSMDPGTNSVVSAWTAGIWGLLAFKQTAQLCIAEPMLAYDHSFPLRYKAQKGMKPQYH